MAIFALADTHLCLSNPEKSMDVFGDYWKDYLVRIADNWRDCVTDSDTVLIAGDISWATYIDKAFEDFEFLCGLHGRKIISRGNHDYWWTSIKKMDEYFLSNDLPGIEVCRTNVIEAEDCLISGTRGWMLPSPSMKAQDRKIYERELLRVSLCIDELAKADPDHRRKRILMLHYPPLTCDRTKTDFTDAIGSGADICVYGHLHAHAHSFAYNGEAIDGCRYICTSSDYCGFRPVRIFPADQG